MQLYPSWSARDNYASKTKRKRKKKDSDCVEGEARKCRARFAGDHQQMWCPRCRKRRLNSKCSESNSLENGNTSDGDEDHCKCDTQSIIISDTVSKLLAKKDQFFADPYSNGQVFCSQSSERNNSQDSNPTSRDYESEQEPSDDDEGTILTATSQPSMLDQDLDDSTAVQF